ncbi:hypothetical protein [Halorussus ruber]|uniref:hypothetical protein n=1 Tax=Halorussus ruber TaxID=1126238 RepID=UPI00109284CF|nr:hypothetical protein [Halorussus ruber]
MAGSTRHFDLYDFFSVLIPGVLFLSGFYLFLPQGLNVGDPVVSLSLLFPILAGGYIAGRFLHISADWLERTLPTVVSHRELLQDELLSLTTDEESPKIVDEDTLRQFCNECTQAFDLDFDFPPSKEEVEAEFTESGEEDDEANDGNDGTSTQGKDDGRIDQIRSAIGDDEPDTQERAKTIISRRVGMVYSLVRGNIHFDARGRSRTFQAIFAFYRSTQLAFLLLGGLYFMAAIWIYLSDVEQLVFFSFTADVSGLPRLLPYPTKIYSIQTMEIGIFVAEILFVLAVFYISFERAKETYRDYYIQYLVTDFLLIQQFNRQQDRIAISIDEESGSLSVGISDE